MNALEETIQRLEHACRRLLGDYPAGLSEYRLLELLRSPSCDLLPASDPGDTMALFQCHFLLFHVLYRLRDEMYREASGELEISPLLIRIAPYRQGHAMLCNGDPLRDYYLDLSQLEQTDEVALQALLGGFWERLKGKGECEQALSVLELDSPADFATIKRQYQRLVMQHHPDRGGEPRRMQELNEAFAVLQRFYR